jgi:omega-6 fatty acid desaturase (delta-12 desaturase)
MPSLAPVAQPLHSHVPAVEAVRLDERSTRKGLSLFVSHGILYFVTLAGALAPMPLGANLLFAVANGVFIALLFILGHDAAHGSLVRSRKLNRRLARLAFIPCAHNVSLWRTIHNQRHHSRTNLKGVDSVWAPMSKAEYDAFTSPRRLLERIYRGPWGPLVYYYAEFWFHRMLLPLAPDVRSQWKRHIPESFFVIGGLVLTVSGIEAVGHALMPERSWLLILAVGWILPFTIWNYLMAFTIYLNHTHPAIIWFKDEVQWRKFKSYAIDTAFVRMPLNLIPVYTKVMAHTAHHHHTNVPVYVLLDAQDKLEKSGLPVITYILTPASYRKIYRACKLFDFERMCWTDFNGEPS